MTDVALRAYLATPLHARTAELCATNEWSERCGFSVPAVYSSPREEEEAIVSRVALSDLSARFAWRIEGPDAAEFLSVALLADVSNLQPGQTIRTLWCDDTGHVRGDGVVVRQAEHEFELSTFVRDLAWFMDGARGFDVKLTNVTGARAVVGVRGPHATELLSLAGLTGEASSAGSVVRPTWRAAQVALMRDASDGYELWTQADDGIVVWDRLWRSGASLGIAAVGATALEAARIEAGIPLAGVDWKPAQLARSNGELLYPADLGFTADPTRHFNGAEGARRARATGREQIMQMKAEEPVLTGTLTLKGSPVGRITSTAWSEPQSAAFALGWVESDSIKPGLRLTAMGQSGFVSVEVVKSALARVL